MDFRRQLTRQFQFLTHSCDLYDHGFHDEAIRIATIARVLFHHTYDPVRNRGSIALIQHLGTPDPKLLSTCEIHPSAGAFQSNLTNMQIWPSEKIFQMEPKLSTATRSQEIDFDEWLNQEIVYVFPLDGQSVRLSRKRLVLVAANQDGGAHVDAQLDRQYEALESGAGWIMTLNPDDGPSEELPLKNGHLSALRQIGYEILHSSELLALQ